MRIRYPAIFAGQPLLLPSLTIGLLGALTGLAYLGLLRLLERGLSPAAWASRPHLLVLGAVGLLVALLMRLLGPPGDVELLVNNIHLEGGERGHASLRSLLPISLVCIAAGGALGPEAPLVQTTGTVGTWLADRWGLGKEETRILAISGMAAGFTVLFGAPIGAALFALEILHRRGLEYHEALMPAVMASLAGYAVSVLAAGSGLQPVWAFPMAGALRPADLAWAAGAGAAAAAGAACFTYANVGLRRLFRLLPPGARPVVGGLALGALALGSPYALTFGERQLGELVSLSPVLGLLLAAAAFKFAGASVTLSSGWRGGFIIPLFFIGAALGRAAHLVWPQSNEAVLMAAAMAGLNTGVTKTPLGSTLVVTGMAGMRLVPTTLAAAVVALLLTSEVGLIESQRARYSAARP